MKIDRSRFLLLTSALAAVGTGCTINQITTTNDATTDSGVASDSGGSDTNVADSSLTDSGSSEVAETSGETNDATTDGDGATCTDDVPAPSDCASILTGIGCHDAVTPTRADDACNGWVADLKAREAKAAQDCLVALMNAAAADAGAPTCEGVDWSSCGVTALETSCPDSTATVWCEGLITECADVAADAAADASTPPTTLDDCKNLASGLTDAGRTAAHTCVVTDGGCTTSLRSCL